MTRDNHRRQDAHKANLDKQGTWVERERRFKKPLAYRPQLRQYIHIDPNNTINPDQDIVTDGTYTLGPVTNAMSKENRLVNVYNDEGKVMGTITEKRLAILHSAYCHTKRVAPKIMQELHATSFVHEVARLVVRYQAGQGKGAEKLLDQRGLPDEYMDALIQSLTSSVNDSLRHSISTQ